MLLFHPSEACLNRFADGDLEARPRARVAKHLQGCGRCRGIVSAIRALGCEARTLKAPGLPAELRARVLSSLRAGAEVIVPIADPARRAWQWQRLVQAGMGVLLVALVLGLVLGPGELSSEASALTFDPAYPLAGSEVSVTYRATAPLAGQDRLKLRAVYRRAGDPEDGRDLRREVVTFLRRGPDGVFHGAFSLPPAVAYGLFAVEDDSGQFVDGRGRQRWEILTTSDHRRPSYDALLQKSYEAWGGNLRVALSAATAATELEPNRVEGWLARGHLERRALGDGSLDSLRAFHLQQLRRLDAAFHDRAFSPQEAGAIHFYAQEWEEYGLAARWRERILAQGPRSSIAVQLRTVALQTSGASAPGPKLEAFERLWSNAPAHHLALTRAGFSEAVKAGQPTDVRLWADRRLELEPWARSTVAEDLIGIPSLEDYTLSLLRREAEDLRAYDDAVRPLFTTVPEYQAASTRERRRVLGFRGRVQLRRGQAQAALAYLDSAVADGWSFEFFADLAQARLATGDVAGAVEMLARLAVDPTHSDSAPSRALAMVDAAAWADQLARAKEQMIAATLAEATPLFLDREVELLDARGEKHHLHDLARGRVTIVAFFWLRCATCLNDLAHLELAREHAPESVQVLLISEDAVSEADLARLRSLGYDYPVLIDANGDAAEAIGVWGWPSYFVLDQRGTIQFSNTNPKELTRQVTALTGAPPILF